jgi:hypothetical protein
MDSDRSQSTEKKESIQYKESTGHALTTIPTSVTLSPEQFETLYLTPMTRRQPEFAKRVGNPTPLLVSQVPHMLCLEICCNIVLLCQSSRWICYYYDPNLMLFDGLEGCQWERSCIHVREILK